MSDGKMSGVSGTSGNNDLRATSDVDGTLLSGGFGDDILRGGKFDDILLGGAGDDQLGGSLGGDQFRFFGNHSNASYNMDGAGDLDKIYDLEFKSDGTGDELVFGLFAEGTFFDAAGVEAFDNGRSVTITSLEGLANADLASDRFTVRDAGNGRITLEVLDAVDGQLQQVYIQDILFSDYQAALAAAEASSTIAV